MLGPKKCLAIAFTTCLTMIVSPWFAQESSNEKTQSVEKADATKAKLQRRVGYLGVQIEPLHPAFWVHLPDVLDHQQGLIIVSVSDASPAAKAGIKPNDILMLYGDQKLFVPEQLEALVHSDKAGTKVALRVLRDGKPLELTATLGEHSFPVIGRSILPKSARPPWWTRIAPHSRSGEGSTWSTFDSMKLQSLGSDRFRADISFQTKEGTIQSKTFEGTRDDIRKEILAEPNLPEVEREHLLRALGIADRDTQAMLPFYFLDKDGGWIGTISPDQASPNRFQPDF